MRKEAGFEVVDRINVYYQAEGVALEVFSSMTTLSEDVLAVSVTNGQVKGYQKEWDIQGNKVIIGVEKA